MPGDRNRRRARGPGRQERVTARRSATRSFIACDHPDHPHAGHFLICSTCGVVVEVEDKRVAEATQDLGERHGFALDHRTLELTGVCGACRR